MNAAPLKLVSCLFIATLLQPAVASDRDDEDASRMPASAAATAEPNARYTRTLTADGRYQVTANFESFGGDALTLGFKLKPADSQQAIREFGVATEELDALVQACRSTKGCNQTEFDRHTTRYYNEHALRLRHEAGKASRLFVDVPQVVQRNRSRVQPVADALRKLASERGYNGEWMMEAAVALVQTGLTYRQPDAWENGRKILGFYPPPLALERGYGDCDTKSALLAAILLNLSQQQKIIGVHVPRHYLLGIAKTPRAGQAYIVHGGQPFVLVEAAGPGKRRPGEISHLSQAALGTMDGVRVDPMF